MRQRAISAVSMSIAAALVLTGWQSVFAATGVMDDNIYQVTNPTTNAAFTTSFESEADSSARKYGYTVKDVVWLSSRETGTGLSPVKRLRHVATNDWLSEIDQAKIAAALASGYSDQGIKYYASSVDTPQTEEVHRFVKNGKHAYALSLSDRAAYVSSGYTDEGVSFYAVPTAADAPEFQAPPPTTITLPNKIYQAVNPATGQSFLTPHQTELTSAQQYGYTQAGEVFYATTTAQTGTAGVHRLYNATTYRFMHEQDATKIAAAVAQGYVDQGVLFYALSTSTTETAPVYRYAKNAYYRYALSASDRSALVADGWVEDGVSFYAKALAPTPPPVPTDDGVFTIAVMGDTQNLSFLGSFDLYKSQMDAVAAKKNATDDLRFAFSVGDIISSGANPADTQADPGQLDRAVESFTRLNTAGVPYSIALGNHDTAVVCGSGSACSSTINDGMTSSNERLRYTSVVNNRLFGQVAPEGVFEAGKMENSYKTFDAEGARWMVLNIELWPRRAALDWAKSVVDAYPAHNVIVNTHMVYNSDGSISASDNGGYGNLSTSTLFNELGSKSNVKMIFSGHVHTGYACTSQAASFGGQTNSVFGCSTAFHGGAGNVWNPDSAFNPVRYLTVDVANGTVSSKIRYSMQRTGSTATPPNYQSLDAIYNLSFIKQ